MFISKARMCVRVVEALSQNPSQVCCNDSNGKVPEAMREYEDT